MTSWREGKCGCLRLTVEDGFFRVSRLVSLIVMALCDCVKTLCQVYLELINVNRCCGFRDGVIVV